MKTELDRRTEDAVERAIEVGKNKCWAMNQLIELRDNIVKLRGIDGDEARNEALDIFEDELSEMEAEREKNKVVLNEKELALVESLRRAVAEAAKLGDTEDGGACNFDSPKLYLPNWKKKRVEAVFEAAGLSAFEHRFFKGCAKGWVICGGTSGIGNRRSRMAEKMAECLTADGYDCGMYYEMD